MVVRDRHADVPSGNAGKARRPFPTLDGMVASDELLSTFDVGDIATEALLFQTGYITILNREDRGGNPYCRLGYLVRDGSRQTRNSIRLCDLLHAADFAGLEQLFHALFAGIPYEWHSRNEIARCEGYCASVFYS